jgi:hypothetical protein
MVMGSPLESGGFREEFMLTNGCSVERVSKQVHKGRNSITPTESVQMVRYTFF